ncbi:MULTISPECIES: ACT domain-containing protein [Fusobacterium]|uniref:ACT domain-containing protein n=1 Tax=Fusobacterium TaxID=848 RepID=UPI001477870B|nr:MULTISPECIES: ACT domain-containing protein [Fusobacterium]NME36324.1 hypothetical protein [Fusobacterium sp. FSA-380-WT-3A]
MTTLYIKARYTPWTLSRLMGLTSRLGILIRNISLDVEEKDSTISISFEEELSKSTHLKKQIERLVDVFEVKEA